MSNEQDNKPEMTAITKLHHILKDKCVWDSAKEDYIVTMSDVREVIEYLKPKRRKQVKQQNPRNRWKITKISG